MSFAIASTGGRIIEVNGGTGTITTMQVAVARIRWVSSAAAQGDTCVVEDAVGNVVFESEATGADFSDEIELGKVPLINGLKVSTLTSGNLYIYLR